MIIKLKIMEEVSQGQNILYTEITNNMVNYSMLEPIIHQGLKIDRENTNKRQNLLKSKDNTIKQ